MKNECTRLSIFIEPVHNYKIISTTETKMCLLDVHIMFNIHIKHSIYIILKSIKAENTSSSFL